MSAIECFWIQPVDATKRSLRRYASVRDSAKCPGPYGYHNAIVDLDVVDVPRSGPLSIRDGADVVPHDDPRWPARCSCGYEFKSIPEEPHQLFLERLYERVDTLARFTLENAPPGAMYDAEWFHGTNGFTGPDGIALMVKLPGGRHEWWAVDGPSKNGGKWSRTGTVPKITANPSILTATYHGFLRDGVLVDA